MDRDCHPPVGGSSTSVVRLIRNDGSDVLSRGESRFVDTWQHDNCSVTRGHVTAQLCEGKNKGVRWNALFMGGSKKRKNA
jgi:hypothetical protein